MQAVWLVGLWSLLGQEAPVGSVVRTVGDVYVLSWQSAEGERAATSGDALYEGDRVRTAAGGRVRILLDDKSVLDLGERTEINMVQVREQVSRARKPSSSVALVVGRLWARVSSLFGGDREVVVRGENAVAGVRGTSFVFEISEAGEDRVTVLRGAVAVRAQAGSEALVTTLQQATVAGDELVVEDVPQSVVDALVTGLRLPVALAPGELERWLATGADVGVGEDGRRSFHGDEPLLDLEPQPGNSTVEGRIEPVD